MYSRYSVCLLVTLIAYFNGFCQDASYQKASITSISSLASQSAIPCFSKGDSEVYKVALTFDDGPTEISRKVVDTLSKYDARGTFFWLGEKLSSNVSFALAVNEKHLIGSHSWDHENGLESSCYDLWENQVLKTNLEFTRIGLPVPKHYRPPYGAITKEQSAYLTSKGMNTVLWSITTLDWDIARNSSNEIFERFKTGLHPNAIILLHDRKFNEEGQNMLTALSRILKYGEKEGIEFVTIDELD